MTLLAKAFLLKNLNGLKYKGLCVKVILMAVLFYLLMGLSALLQIQVITSNSDLVLIFSYVIGVLLSALIIVFIMRSFFKANYKSIACVAMLASIPYILFTAKLIPLWPGVSTSSILRSAYEVLVIYLSFGMAYLIYNLIQTKKKHDIYTHGIKDRNTLK